MRVEAGYRSGGTGFIFDTTGETGFVVTNHHVVEDDTGSIDVITQGRSYVGTLLGYDSSTEVDVAVLSICCSPKFHALPWEAGGTFSVGSEVMAMGRPRDVPVSTTGKVVFDIVPTIFDVDLITHDAPLQAGSSGGPLLTMDGKVLGINTAASKLTDGVFFAVPYAAVADQVLEWKTRLVVVNPTPAPVLGASELQLMGVGTKELFWSVPKGRYIVTVTVKGNGGERFYARFENVRDGEVWSEAEYDVSDQKFTYLVDVLSSDEATKCCPDLHPGRHLVKVDAQGSWAITFEPAR